MPTFCAAFGSFHVKSSSTSFVIFLRTVRVLPFFLTVTLMRDGTLIVSIFRARWYAAHRYWSMQICGTRHSSSVSRGLTTSFVSPCTGSDELTDAICPDAVSDGRASGKATLTIVPSPPETTSCSTATDRGGPAASDAVASDIARPPSSAKVFSMPGQPKLRSPAASAEAKTTVPHKAASASRRGLTAPSLPVSSDTQPDRLHVPA